MIGRFNGIDILFIILIGIYLIAFCFIIFYLGGNILDSIELRHRAKKHKSSTSKSITPIVTETKTNPAKKTTTKKTTPKSKSSLKKPPKQTKELVNKEKVKAHSPNNAPKKKASNNTTNKNNGYHKATKKKTPAKSTKKKTAKKRF